MARPRFIVVLRDDVARRGKAKSNPLDHLPHNLCCSIIAQIFEFTDDIFKNEFELPVEYTIEMHTGTWQSQNHFHFHVILPYIPYLRLMRRKQPARANDFCEKRAAYVKKTVKEHAKFLRKDKNEIKTMLHSMRRCNIPSLNSARVELGVETSTLHILNDNNAVSRRGIAQALHTIRAGGLVVGGCTI